MNNYRSPKQHFQTLNAQKKQRRRLYEYTRNINLVIIQVNRYALTQRTHVWKGRRMDFENITKKGKALISPKMNSSYPYDFLFKENCPLIIKKNQRISQQWINLNQEFNLNELNKEKGNEQTRMLILVLRDYFPPMLQMFRKIFYGKRTISQKLVNLLNHFFDQFGIDQNQRFQQDLIKVKNNDWSLGNLLQDQILKIKQREQGKLQTQFSKSQKEQFKKQKKQVEALNFPLGNCKDYIVTCKSKQIQSEGDFAIAMNCVRKTFSEYFFPSNSQENLIQQKDINRLMQKELADYLESPQADEFPQQKQFSNEISTTSEEIPVEVQKSEIIPMQQEIIQTPSKSINFTLSSTINVEYCSYQWSKQNDQGTKIKNDENNDIFISAQWPESSREKVNYLQINQIFYPNTFEFSIKNYQNFASKTQNRFPKRLFECEISSKRNQSQISQNLQPNHIDEEQSTETNKFVVEEQLEQPVDISCFQFLQADEPMI